MKKAFVLCLLVLVALGLALPAQCTVFYVKPTGSDENDGLSWATAKRTVQAALSLASRGDQVWVAAGQYYERVSLPDGVELYGGFRGTETSPSQRPSFPRWSDPDPYETALNGQEQGPVIVTGFDSSVPGRIDGFTIAVGTCGIYCYSSIVITNNIIVATSGGTQGGGIRCHSCSPTITNNIISSNIAQSGAGIWCYYASPIISNNIIAGNWATSDGGAITCLYSSPIIRNNTIVRNHAPSYGGIECIHSSPYIVNNIITENTAEEEKSGGIGCFSSSPVIANNTIVNNTGPQGGGIGCFYFSSPTIYNNIIAFNSSGIYCGNDCSPTLKNNCLFNPDAENYIGMDPGEYDMLADPLFVDMNNSDYHLRQDSPCIESGYDAAVEAGWVDIDNQARICGLHVDIGADEWYPPKPSCVSLTPATKKLCPGNKYTFTATWRDEAGYSRINYCYVLFNSTSSPSGKQGCYVCYDQAQNKLYLRNNESTSWLGGFAPGSSEVIENSYCRLYCAESSVSGSDNTLTLQLRIEFKQTLADKTSLGTTLNAWMYATDNWGFSSSWAAKGSYTWLTPVTISPPTSKLPAATKYTLSTTWRDDAGYGDIKYCYLILNSTSTATGKQGCYVLYDQSQNKLYLRNDAGTAWLGGYAPGSANTIENSYAKLYCAETSVSGSGKILTLNLRLEFKPALADKTTPGSSLKAWMLVIDNAGAATSWLEKGAYTWLTPAGISPSKGTISAGTKYTFVTTWRDDAGYTDIKYGYLIFNTGSTPSGKQGCYVCYDTTQNKLYLRNDAGTAWLGGYAPGSANTIENSYAKLYCAETSVSGSGKIGTLNLRLEFKSALLSKIPSGGSLNAWMLIVDQKSSASGWILRGTYSK
jgi:hypothetical protein